jgi:hypothetical protein
MTLHEGNNNIENLNRFKLFIVACYLLKLNHVLASFGSIQDPYHL